MTRPAPLPACRCRRMAPVHECRVHPATAVCEVQMTGHDAHGRPVSRPCGTYVQDGAAGMLAHRRIVHGLAA